MRCSLLAVVTLLGTTRVLGGCAGDDVPPAGAGSSASGGGAGESSETGVVTSETSADSSAGTTVGTTGDSPIACDLFVNDCPAGDKCMPYASVAGGDYDGTRCTAVAGDAVDVGERCAVEGTRTSGLDNCIAQAICWFVDDTTLAGECVRMCDNDTVDPGCDLPCDGLCTIASELAPPLCLEPCDPLTLSCAAGRSCVAADTHFVCVLDRSGDAGAIGDSCAGVDACDPGLFCLSALAWPDCEGPGGCCAPACTVGDPEACAGTPDGVTCLAWYGEGTGPPSTACTPFQEIGVCGLG